MIILVVLSVMYNELNTDKQSAGFNDDIDIEFEVPKTCVLSTRTRKIFFKFQTKLVDVFGALILAGGALYLISNIILLYNWVF